MTEVPLIQMSIAAPLPVSERARFERQARLLAWGGIGYHIIEFAVALIAGIAAGSIADRIRRR